jgi:UDPglucose 6-dehydrogenase
MRVAMIGTGYVGLVSGACFSEFGHHVVCVDKDRARIAMIGRQEMPIYEPGLKSLVERNVAAGRLTFTTELPGSVKGAEAVFIAVGTPSRRGDGEADLSYVFAAAAEIAPFLDGRAVVITKSTVPVGTGREVRRVIAAARPALRFDVASNPEFLREGSAIEDFMRPDRVVCGAESQRAREVLRALYRPLFLNETPVLFTSLEAAELIKYASNAFLAAKITFINEMADLCEKVGVNVQDVARGIGHDRRIGPKFLHPGPGFGGSCFPKDARALVGMAQRVGAPTRLIETVLAVNDQRKRAMAQRVIAAGGGSVQGKTIAVLGVTFKPNTDDMRESPSLDIVPALQAAGASIRAFDPEGMDEARKMLPGVAWCKDTYDAMTGADLAVIITEWNQFRALDLARVKGLLKQPVMVDFRNIYRPADVAAAGIAYHSLGQIHVSPNEIERGEDID